MVINVVYYFIDFFTGWQSGIMVRGLEFQLKHSEFKCTCCHLKSCANLITPICRCVDEYLYVDRGGCVYAYNLHAVMTAWLDTSQRNQDGVQLNRSARE